MSEWAQRYAYAAKVAYENDQSTDRFLICKPCDVTWRGPFGDLCFCCGEPGTFISYWEAAV